MFSEDLIEVFAGFTPCEVIEVVNGEAIHSPECRNFAGFYIAISSSSGRNIEELIIRDKYYSQCLKSCIYCPRKLSIWTPISDLNSVMRLIDPSRLEHLELGFIRRVNVRELAEYLSQPLDTLTMFDCRDCIQHLNMKFLRSLLKSDKCPRKLEISLSLFMEFGRGCLYQQHEYWGRVEELILRDEWGNRVIYDRYNPFPFKEIIDTITRLRKIDIYSIVDNRSDYEQIMDMNIRYMRERGLEVNQYIIHKYIHYRFATFSNYLPPIVYPFSYKTWSPIYCGRQFFNRPRKLIRADKELYKRFDGSCLTLYNPNIGIRYLADLTKCENICIAGELRIPHEHVALGDRPNLSFGSNLEKVTALYSGVRLSKKSFITRFPHIEKYICDGLGRCDDIPFAQMPNLETLQLEDITNRHQRIFETEDIIPVKELILSESFMSAFSDIVWDKFAKRRMPNINQIVFEFNTASNSCEELTDVLERLHELVNFINKVPEHIKITFRPEKYYKHKLTYTNFIPRTESEKEEIQRFHKEVIETQMRLIRGNVEVQHDYDPEYRSEYEYDQHIYYVLHLFIKRQLSSG